MTRPELEGLFHTGMVVDDLATAMAGFSEVLGARWAQPLRMEVPLWTDHGIVRRESWTTYSIDAGGAHHLELIEDVAATAWAAPGRSRLHHIGVWSQDLVARSAHLADMGWARVLTDGTDGTPGNFVYHDPGHGGLFVELLASSLKPVMAPWLEGRGAPGSDGG